MKAKDTVMKDWEIVDIANNWATITKADNDCEALCQAQAEISFKAGIKEVVEWLDIAESNEWETVAMSFPLSEWQAKLEEWGIE